MPVIFGPDWMGKLIADGALVNSHHGIAEQKKVDAALRSQAPTPPDAIKEALDAYKARESVPAPELNVPNVGPTVNQPLPPEPEPPGPVPMPSPPQPPVGPVPMPSPPQPPVGPIPMPTPVAPPIAPVVPPPIPPHADAASVGATIGPDGLVHLPGQP